MTQITVAKTGARFNRPMYLSIIALTIMLAWASASRRDRRYELIASRPYNNQYSDAAAARDERALFLRSRYL